MSKDAIASTAPGESTDTTPSAMQGKNPASRLNWGRRALIGSTALLLVGGIGWWAGRATLGKSQQNSTQAPSQVTVTVTEATVGRALNLNATATQPMQTMASNMLPGVVTHITPSGTLNSGDAAYSVNNIAVRVVEGTFPFYRELSEGATGDDVAQLQGMLAKHGARLRVDGVFGASTTAAVKAWQKKNKEEETGILPLGTLVAIPRLPAVVSLGKDITVGALLDGKEESIRAHVGTPEFFMNVSETQRALIPAGAIITITFEDLTWTAIVTEQKTDENSGHIRLGLGTSDGSRVCGHDCSRLPAAEETLLKARVQLVPEASGPAVPVAAVRTDATGAAYVLRPDGSHTPVTVRGSGDGIAVVDGLSLGETVVVLDGSSPDTTLEKSEKDMQPKGGR